MNTQLRVDPPAPTHRIMSARLWIVVGSALLLGTAIMVTVALGSVDDSRAGVASAEALALATLLLFAVPIALVRARKSVRSATWILASTVISGFLIDACLYWYVVANPPTGDAVLVASIWALPMIVLGGPFKVLLVESVVFLIAAAQTRASLPRR